MGVWTTQGWHGIDQMQVCICDRISALCQENEDNWKKSIEETYLEEMQAAETAAGVDKAPLGEALEEAPGLDHCWYNCCIADGDGDDGAPAFALWERRDSECD